MGKLAKAPYADGYSKITQVQFGGLNHRESCADGELYDMQNMTADEYPLMRPRKRRTFVRGMDTCVGLYGYDGLVAVEGTTVRYKNIARGTLKTSGEKIITAMGPRIVIWPDKVVLNVKYERLGTFQTLEALQAGVTSPEENDAYGVGSDLPYEIYVWDGSKWVSNGKELQEIEASVSAGSVSFQGGTYAGESAEANTIYKAGMDWAQYFKEGDAVTISGCTVHPENNKTPIIREIDGAYLRFYENTFVLDGTDGTTDYTESGVTLARTAPDMDYICAVDNRVWGCRNDTIYGCKLGDPMNWNCFEGLATDSFFVDAGTPGRFTACAGYLGYPTFFKEEQLFKLYGSKPQNYQLQASATLGVGEGMHKTLAVAGETLFYVSRAGVAAYTGGIPEIISQSLGIGRILGGAGGSDGKKYYVRLTQEEGTALYVFDTEKGVWMKEDGMQAQRFAWTQQSLYCVDNYNRLWVLNREPADGAETDVTSFAQFGDFTEGTLDRKKYTKLQMRLAVMSGSVSVGVQYDAQTQWQTIRTFTAGTGKDSFLLSFRPRRCDRFRLRIDGTGEYIIYGITRQAYGGSDI